MEVRNGRESKHSAYGGHPDSRSEGLSVIEARALTEALCNQAALVSLNGTVRIELLKQNPLATDRCTSRRQLARLPSPISDVSLDFFVCSGLPLVTIRSAQGFLQIARIRHRLARMHTSRGLCNSKLVERGVVREGFLLIRCRSSCRSRRLLNCSTEGPGASCGRLREAGAGEECGLYCGAFHHSPGRL